MLVVYILISISWSADPGNGINTFIRHYFRWFAIFGIALILFNDKKVAENAITAFLFGMVVSEIISYGMYYGLWTLNGRGQGDPVPFMNHIEYSLFLAIASIILLNRIFSKRYSKITKVSMGVFFITATTNLFISNGRTGQVAFLVAIFISFFIHNKLAIKKIISIVTMTIILFGSAYIFNSHFKNRINAGAEDLNSIKSGKFYNSIGLRLLQYPIAWKIFQYSPLLGVGIGGRSKAVIQLIENKELSYPVDIERFIVRYHSHNQFLQQLIETGAIGTILSLLVFYYLSRLKSSNPEINELSILFTIVFVIASFFEPMWIKQFSETLFIFFSGVVLGASVDKGASREAILSKVSFENPQILEDVSQAGAPSSS